MYSYVHNFNETGSSPPRDKHSKTPGTIFVLDIAGTAPQPFTYCALALRKPDSRRRSTQTWRFTDDGRLCCAHKNMCVQSKDGFMGLYEGWNSAFIYTHLLIRFMIKLTRNRPRKLQISFYHTLYLVRYIFCYFLLPFLSSTYSLFAS